jgi:hypothetical protein
VDRGRAGCWRGRGCTEHRNRGDQGRLYRLENLVAGWLRGRQAGEVALAQHESQPEQWGPALQAELVAADAAQDTAVVQAAQRVMDLVDPAGSQAGK